jgi:hypothetical protein
MLLKTDPEKWKRILPMHKIQERLATIVHQYPSQHISHINKANSNTTYRALNRDPNVQAITKFAWEKDHSGQEERKLAPIRRDRT